MTTQACHALDHVTATTVMLDSIIDEALELIGDDEVYPAPDAEQALRTDLPGLLAVLPPDSVDLLKLYIVQVRDLVAFAHWCDARFNTPKA